MSPAPDDLSKDDLEEIIELTDVIEEGPGLASQSSGDGFEDELASLLDGQSTPSRSAAAEAIELSPPESPSAGRATAAELDELDDLFADLDKPASNAASDDASALAGPDSDIEGMLADIRAHAAEPAGDEAAAQANEDLDTLLAGLDEARNSAGEEALSADVASSAVMTPEEDQELSAILGELESAAEPAVLATQAEEAGPSSGDLAVEAKIEAVEEAEEQAMETAALVAAEPEPIAPAVDTALLDSLREEIAALREAQAELAARLDSQSAAEARLEGMEERLAALAEAPRPPDPAEALHAALAQDSPLFADLSHRLSDQLAAGLDARLESALGPRLEEFGASVRAQALSELQDSLPPAADPAEAVAQALAEGSPLFADLVRRLAEELAGDLARDLKVELRAELEALVPEAAARVIREEIAALAEDAAQG